MISLFTLAIQEKISLYKLYRVVYPYPTFSSGILKVADAFLRDTLTGLRTELPTFLLHRWVRPVGGRVQEAGGQAGAVRS
jgi:hypothetical protein